MITLINLYIKISIIHILTMLTQIPGLKSSLIDCFKGGMQAKNAMTEIIKNNIDPTI